MNINKYFFEVFENIPRQGPGSYTETKKAFSYLKDLPENPKILDIGCGKGKQTIDLASISNANIIALDRYTPFLKALQKRLSEHNLQNRITCLIGDMGEMPFLEEEFDAIWAEGSAFIIGYKQALSSWKSYIKRKGYLAFSDCVWFKDNPPKDLDKFWEKEGFTLPSINDILDHAKEEGYQLVNHFTVSQRSWKEEFYNFIEQELAIAKEKYRGNVEAQDTFYEFEREIEVFDNYHEYYGYEFFVFQKG